MQQIAASLSPASPPRSLCLDFDDPLPADGPAAATLIVKTHGTQVARDLGRQAQGIVITIRDPRDAAISLTTTNKLPFDIALRMTEVSAMTCAPFARHPRAVLLRFEDRFFEDPATVDRVATSP